MQLRSAVTLQHRFQSNVKNSKNDLYIALNMYYRHQAIYCIAPFFNHLFVGCKTFIQRSIALYLYSKIYL